jgi:hypothetical protein
MRHFCLTLALLLATPALAETPMTAQDFDAFATGKTLTYQRSGQLFGTEEYLPGRKVRWYETGKGCSNGTWFAQDQSICFTYTGSPEPACWIFVRSGDRVVAHSMDDAPGDQPFQVAPRDTPLSCTED